MEEFLMYFARYTAFGIETIAILVIACGAVQAVVVLVRPKTHQVTHRRKEVWQGFAMWLILGLEFMLAADIVRTVVSPTWVQLGQLASIAFIRTFLNYFLEKDLEKYSEQKRVPS